MTHRELNRTMANWYREQIEWNKKVIGWCNREIEYLTRELERSRKDDRELVEWVWSKGVVTEWEIRTYGNGSKYQSTETHKNLLARRREYLKRKKANKEIARYERLLAGEM